MEKILLNCVNTFGSVFNTYTVKEFSLKLIFVALFIIICMVIYWAIRTFKEFDKLVQEEEREARLEKNSSSILIDNLLEIRGVKDTTIVIKNKNDATTSKLGNHSATVNTAEKSIAVSTGDYSVAVATFEESFAKVEGKDSIAIVCGTNGKGSGRLGCWLILTERGEWNGKEYPLKDIKSIKVDGEKIKEDTWYKLKNGEIIEEGSSEDKIEP